MFLFPYVLAIFVVLKNEKMSQRLKKEIYLFVSVAVVTVLTIIRCVCPDVVADRNDVVHQEVEKDVTPYRATIKITPAAEREIGLDVPYVIPQFRDVQGRIKKTKIYSVPSYTRAFPDLQDVQLVAAKKWGVSPVKDRKEAEVRKEELVYVGSNPYYTMDDKMNHSVPYLVPRASDLLQKISRNFMDSLTMKRIPLHTLIVTSVLRTEDDVRRLRRVNVNASPESCHRYGTTFDICYNRFNRVEKDKAPLRNGSLKWVLSEVLRDLRQQGLCYVKYEIKQGCFHITVR